MFAGHLQPISEPDYNTEPQRDGDAKWNGHAKCVNDPQHLGIPVTAAIGHRDGEPERHAESEYFADAKRDAECKSFPVDLVDCLADADLVAFSDADQLTDANEKPHHDAIQRGHTDANTVAHCFWDADGDAVSDAQSFAECQCFGDAEPIHVT